MIHVVVTYQSNELHSVEISGHAFYGEPGEDIVCAGVSCVLYGVCEMLAKHGFLTEDRGVIMLDDGYGFVEILNGTRDDQLILETLVVSLQLVEETYSDNIKIVKKEA